MGPYSPLFNGYRGTHYLCVIQLGIEACHLPPWHAEGLLYHLHMTSALLYSMNVFPWTVLISNIRACHHCICIHARYTWQNVQCVVILTIGNIAPKCLWLIIECRLAGMTEMWTEVDYLSFRYRYKCWSLNRRLLWPWKQWKCPARKS